MIKKTLFIALVILLGYGIANAAGIPVTVDPKNVPEVWTQEVYNNSSSAIASGVVVIWDYDTSDVTEAWDDDRCPWVKVPTASLDVWTAGTTILNEGIAAKSTGRIVIKGPTYVRTGASGTVNELVGGTITTGYTVDYAAAANKCAVGRVIKADASTNAPGVGYTLVDVNVWCSDQ